ncbi:cytochrome P450 monooxygenase, nitrosative stress-induced transcript, partial [Histoplasma capsulatum]
MSAVANLLTYLHCEFQLGWPLVAISILSLMILNLCRSMYRAINSPFPGPKLAKFTSLWLRWHELRDGILNTTHRAHRNYGPIVQLSPKMISFCHPDAIKDIYTGSRGGLDAIDLVWFFERYGSPNVVSTVDAELHLIRRKNVAGLYSSPVAASPAFQTHIKTTIDTLMNEIEAEAGSEQPLSWTV